MAEPTYRRLGGRRWLRWQSDDGWLAPDHLLFVRTRFFSEQYTRLYWNDVQALLLYRFAHNTGLMFGAELIVVSAAAAVAAVQNRFEITAVAFCYVAAYAAWRLTRRNHGVQVLTRTATARIPLAIFHRSARRMVNQLQQQVEGAQGNLAAAPQVSVREEGYEGEGVIELAAVEPVVVRVTPADENRARPILALHGIVFALGLTSWLFTRGSVLSDPNWTPVGWLLTIVFFGGLAAMFFVQQDPEFPFAVRSAAVMILLLYAAVVGTILALNPASVTAKMEALSPSVTLLQLLACLFGLIGIYKNSLDESDRPVTPSRTGSNPLA
jgi:hypothetical protein